MAGSDGTKRAIISLSGRVQGVGFRPFVFRIAEKFGIKGHVLNDAAGVTIDAEGSDDGLNGFLSSLDSEKPSLALINKKEIVFAPPAFHKVFYIKDSDGSSAAILNPDYPFPSISIPPDVALCGKCAAELNDASDRRYFYPFINCTDCGPRFTISEKLPYDRASTVMNAFKMCQECEAEYKNPLNRRFHAEPDCCFECGPEIKFIYGGVASGSIEDYLGADMSSGHKPLNSLGELKSLVRLIDGGGIACVKGVGGFHLMADAGNDEAVKKLRNRKNRPRKPFAVMFKDLLQVSEYAYLDDVSSALLTSKERPVCLLRDKSKLAFNVNHGIRDIGVFLPYSPIHHIIFVLLGRPLVATSANLDGEPIAKDNAEAFYKLRNIADGYLIHNRDILRRCDDSVVRTTGKTYFFIRRSRGYVPEPVALPFFLKRKVLSVGSVQKNTFAIAGGVPPEKTENAGYKAGGVLEDKCGGSSVILSQHNGDLDCIAAFENFTGSIKDFEKFYGFHPDVIVCDGHPAFENSKWAESEAEKRGITCVKLQHHRAHIISCMAENGLMPGDEIFGTAFDGNGFGDDGSVWGGEFFKGTYTGLERIGWLQKFRLIGGDKAARSPGRVLLSMFFSIFYNENVNYDDFFEEKTFLTAGSGGYEIKLNEAIGLTGISTEEAKIFFKMWLSGLNSPYSSSCGRLFDAVSLLCGFTGNISYEGEAAVYLSDLCAAAYEENANAINGQFNYLLEYDKNSGTFEVCWKPMILEIAGIIIKNCREKPAGAVSGEIRRNIALRFIETLPLIIRDAAALSGLKKVCLSGGVFQNRILAEKTAAVLKEGGFTPYFNEKIPPNDGGISFGQAVYGGLIKL